MRLNEVFRRRRGFLARQFTRDDLALRSARAFSITAGKAEGARTGRPVLSDSPIDAGATGMAVTRRRRPPAARCQALVLGLTSCSLRCRPHGASPPECLENSWYPLSDRRRVQWTASAAQVASQPLSVARPPDSLRLRIPRSSACSCCRRSRHGVDAKEWIYTYASACCRWERPRSHVATSTGILDICRHPPVAMVV